jgi:hypothetical protein
MIFSFPLSPILSVFADLLRRYQCQVLSGENLGKTESQYTSTTSSIYLSKQFLTAVSQKSLVAKVLAEKLPSNLISEFFSPTKDKTVYEIDKSFPLDPLALLSKSKGTADFDTHENKKNNFSEKKDSWITG